MNDTQYERTINNYEKTIYSLKQYIEELETKVNHLQSLVFDMKKTRKFLLDEERKNQKLTEEKHEQQKEINTLEEKNLELTKTTRSQNTQQILKLENQISYYKSLQESGAAKIENAEIILKLNETQHNTILNLEKKIEDLKEQNKTNITQLKIEHERHYLKLKKNMLDVIKKGQAASSKKNADDLELNTKFGIIYKNQLLNELERQSIQIQKLLEDSENKDKIIYALQQELKTHEKVEEIISEKNKKYFKLAQKNVENEEKTDLKKSEKTIKNSISFKNMSKKEYQNYKNLEKIYKNTLEENYNLRDRLDTLRDKERIFQNKYHGILNMYENALNNLLKDEEIKKQKNIYINIKEIKKGNWDFFTKEEKYCILIMLIKNLLPIIQIENEDKEISDLKEKIENMDNKMNKTQSKYSSSTRHQTLTNPFFGFTGSNLYNKSNSNDDCSLLNGCQKFPYNKSIFPLHHKSGRLSSKVCQAHIKIDAKNNGAETKSISVAKSTCRRKSKDKRNYHNPIVRLLHFQTDKGIYNNNLDSKIQTARTEYSN